MSQDRRTPTRILVALTIVQTLAIASAPAQERRLRPEEANVRTEKVFPTGDRATSAVLIERIAPAQVRRGDEFSYEIRVTNLTRGPLDNVTLTEQFPAGFELRGVLPRPAGTDRGRATWQFARLGPGASESIQVRGAATQLQELTGCASVTFSVAACMSVAVVEPKLALQKAMPAEALACDDIPIRFLVANTGTGTLRGVRIEDVLPRGLTTREGYASFTIDVGDLAAGQTREYTVVSRASETGQFRNTATARDASGLAAQASASTIVRKPVLTLRKTAPDFRYLGRPAAFELLVSNTGDAPATNTVLTDPLAAGLEFVDADNGGRLSGGAVVWDLGTIPPGGSRKVAVRLTPREIGMIRNTATVRAVCAEASAESTLAVRGIPAILLEVIDVEDPIEVGASETYVITVTNQGSSSDTNIVVTCTLPPEMEFVSADGPTAGQASGREVVFAPLASLAPKSRATYHVVVRGTQVGDLRFKVSMRSDQTTSPVEETESTHVY